MTNLSVVDQAQRSKDASSGAPPSAYHLHAPQQKKAARSVEADVSYLCSAYLAERGCLSPGKSQKRTAA
jgi:hypothetical protein